MSPMIAQIGEVPEAVIPLSKLSSMFNLGESSGLRPVHIEINNPIVRSDEDLRQIINAVQQELGMELSTKFDLLGRGMGF